MNRAMKEQSSIKSKAVSGVKWNGISMGVVTALQFVTLAILARILNPSDFGILGIIMVVINFAQTFSDMGLSNALIQRKNVPSNHLSSFFWINILIGIVIFIFIYFIKSIAAIYFKLPSLSNYLVISAFIFLIVPIGQIFSTILMKELKFNILSKIEIAGMAVYSISSIGLALANCGVLSLIFGQLIRSLFTVIFLYFIFRKTWLPKLHFNIRELKTYFAFGAFQTGERIANYLSANIDYIIIGRLLGTAALGFYTLAYQIIIFPLTKINPIITRVAFPVFSIIQDDNDSMRKGYCKVLQYISILTFPMLVGMLVVAPEFIRLFYGKKWSPSIIVLQILSVVGIFKSLGNPIGSVLLSKGRADIGFYWNVFAVIVISIAVILGVNWGIVGVSVALLVLQVPLFSIIQPIVNRLIDLKFSQYFKVIKSSAICSAIMLLGITSLRKILGNVDILLFFIISVASGMILYISLYYIIDRTLYAEMKSMIRLR
jgi:lipopolysaccharide exporter